MITLVTQLTEHWQTMTTDLDSNRGDDGVIFVNKAKVPTGFSRGFPISLHNSAVTPFFNIHNYFSYM